VGGVELRSAVTMDDHLAEAIARAAVGIDQHPAWCLAKHQAGPGTEWASLPFRSGVTLFRDRLLARSMLLTQGGRSARADDNTYVLVLCARAYIETTGSLAQLILKLSRLRAGTLDAGQWQDALSRLVAGAKTDLDDGISIQPFNVVTLVDAIADALALAGVPHERSEVRESYDLASEWAHPNAGGTAVDWHDGVPEVIENVIAAQWVSMGYFIRDFETLMDYLDKML
jgi:hypothetical protein